MATDINHFESDFTPLIQHIQNNDTRAAFQTTANLLRMINMIISDLLQNIQSKQTAAAKEDLLLNVNSPNPSPYCFSWSTWPGPCHHQYHLPPSYGLPWSNSQKSFENYNLCLIQHQRQNPTSCGKTTPSSH